MHAISYITAELSLLCKEYKDALTADKDIKAEKIADEIQKTVEWLTVWCPDFHMDSLFFAGELDHHGKEHETEYPESVKAWRARRELRRKQKRTDDDEEAEKPSGGHGNTKLPFGLCEKYGIEVQNGWTPREAWEALEGKGVSAKEEYRKLKEKQKAAETKKAQTVSRHEAARASFLKTQEDAETKRKELLQKQYDARGREINLEYGSLSQCKSRFLKAEQERVKAKELYETINGRNLDELNAELEDLDKKHRELEEINHKYYDRPPRKTPEYDEWREWCQSLGGREAIQDMLNNEFFTPGGTADRFNKVQRAINAYKLKGPDAGYGEAVKNSKALKKEQRDLEAELEKTQNEIKEYQRQVDEGRESVHKAKTEYFEAVKERFPTIDDCRTASDVAERLTAEDFFEGTNISCDFGEKVSVDTAKASAKALVDFMDKVPYLKGHCGRLCIENMAGTENSNCFGFSEYGRVALNEKYYADPERFDKAFQEGLDTMFHPPGTTKDSVVHHEYAHQLDRYFSDRWKEPIGKFSAAALKSVSAELGMTERDCMEAVSKYSVNNRSGGAIEWFAEAFSEYTNSKNPRPIAVALGRYVNEYAKTIGLTRNDSVESYRARRQKRLDEKEEEGRWVTTENDHRIHLNEEGVPDKGNPYVLAVMRGEGENPKSREELVRHRLQRQARQHRAVYSALSDAEKELRHAQDESRDAENSLRKTKMKKKMADRGREQLRELGYGEGDREQMQKDYDELDNEIKSLLNGRDKWSLKGDEAEAYHLMEGKANQLKWHLGSYDEYFGPEAVTDRTVKDAEKRFSDAQRREKKAQEAADDARKATKRLSGSPDQESFLTSQERTSAIEEIQNSDMWNEMSEVGKTKALEDLQNTSDAQLLLLQKTAGNVRIHDSHGYASPSGSSSWYMPGTGAITMSQEDMENGKTLWHEFGHYLDDPKISGCDTDSRESLGYTMQVSLSGALEHSYALHNENAANDLQKLFSESEHGNDLEFGTWGNGVLKITKKDGGYAESPYDPAFCSITDEFSNRFHRYIFDDEEFDKYCKEIGYPQESEDPKWDDYFERYNTPKRKLQRIRPRFKGAEEEYHQKVREISEKRQKILEEHPEYYDRLRERNKRCDERSGRVGPVSDIICAMFRGNGPWIYGSHSPTYYSRSSSPYSEAVANYHQMRMMGWTGELNLLKRLVPSVHDELERTYNEWLWRNLDL